MLKIFRIKNTHSAPYNARLDFAAAAVIITSILFAGVGITHELSATTLGERDLAVPSESDEILEPSAIRPKIPVREAINNFGEPAAFSSIPATTIQNSESLEENETRKAEALLSRWSNLANQNLFQEQTVDTTKLEWVRQLAQTGHWLENDQWADFKAIALATYLPEIRFWLDRNRWASFGTSLYAGGFGNGFLDDPDTAGPLGSHFAANTAGYSNVSSYKSGSGKSTNPQSKEATFISVFSLFASMTKKIAQQPVFYFILAGGLFFLVWVIRRQRTG